MKKEKIDILPIVLIAAAVVMVFLAYRFRSGDPGSDVSTAEGREQFLAELGWTVDPDSEEEKSVLIPSCETGIMAEYNALQLSQGYDLSRWVGKTLTQVSYRVTNYPGYDQPVYVTLYLSGRHVIAGDIHSAALNGFMHGLTRKSAEEKGAA